MITIVDYGLGNIAAFANVYKRMNIPVAIARTANELEAAQRIILPGVGAFDHAIELLDASGMRAPLAEHAERKGTPILGVCVGMQILADGSEEGMRAGLGWIPGTVRHFSAAAESAGLPLPHMGWNDVRPVPDQPLFADLEDARFYFLHSYFIDCADDGHVVARADYGLEFGCAVRNGNVAGVQFHPEKSHNFGATLLKNFALS